MTLVTISPTYRITIPREIREKYNFKPGQKVYFETALGMQLEIDLKNSVTGRLWAAAGRFNRHAETDKIGQVPRD